MRSLIRGRTAAAMVAAVCLMSTSACSGEQPGTASSPGSSAASSATVGDPATTSTAAAPLTTQTEVKKVVGKLKTGGRGRLAKAVTPVVDAWWEAAYLGGTWPRTSFGDAFPGFTHGAAQEARGDQDLLSNADIGSGVTGVSATQRDVRLDVIAPSGRIAGVTARIALDFETTGEQPHQVSVRGRVFLTRKEGTWRIFGYDVRKAVT